MALSKRALQSMATRENIRNVALNIFKAHTIDEISVQDICREAGVGVGTFYHYYKSKDDIVQEVYGEMDAHFLLLAEEVKNTDIDPYTYVLRHLVCYARFVEQSTVDFARKVYSLQSKVFIDWGRPVYTTLKSFLLAKQENGEVSKELDVDAFCAYVNIWLRGLAFDWCLFDGRYDLVQKALEYADHILSGYRSMLGQ